MEKLSALAPTIGKKSAVELVYMGWGAFRKHSQITNSRLPLSLKVMAHNQGVLPVVNYGAETWRLTKHPERKLRSRRTAGVKLRDNKRASWIKEHTRVEDIKAQINRG